MPKTIISFFSPSPCFNLLHLHPSKFSFSPTKLIHCSTHPDIGTQITAQNLGYGSQQEHSQNPNPSLNFDGLVFGVGSKNSWDSGGVGSPVVKRFLSDEEERWYLWYHGTSSNDLTKDMVGLAVSSNGIHWTRGNGGVQSATDVGMVMNVSEDWWALDTQSIRPAEVVIMSSSKIKGSSAVYWLYFTGYSNSEHSLELSSILAEESAKRNSLADQVKFVGEDGRVCKSIPGLAMSQDGRHWARIEGEHHSGALLDVGSDQEWDSAFISSPQVVFHQPGDLRMYYHSYDIKALHFTIGMARSRDGINWVKLGNVLGAGPVGAFDELGAMNPCVVRKKDGTYVMAYEGVNGVGRRSVGLAESTDGLREWRRVGEGPVLEATDGETWDNGGVGSPCLVHMEGEACEWRMFYTGVSGDGRSGIGMAVSDGSKMGVFRRWKGFHL